MLQSFTYILAILWSFYKKIIATVMIIALAISILMKMANLPFLKTLFHSIAITLPIIHGLVYVLQCPSEMIFYNNLGFGSAFFWKSTAIMSIILLLTGLSLHI